MQRQTMSLCMLEQVLRYAVAAPGQTMIRQGDHGDMMFVILAGDAQVYAVTDNGDRSEVSR